jgi:hypothetical protein
MNKPQAVALLELIADLYRLANQPEPDVEAAASTQDPATSHEEP